MNNLKIHLDIRIENSEKILEKLLSSPNVQEFWEKIREKFKGEIDEKELYKIFKIYLFSLVLKAALEKLTKDIQMPKLLDAEFNYTFYKDKESFRGKLNKKIFNEILKKIWSYHREIFIEDLY